jgi:uncharacterized repeat protein (TIGR03847 family)
MPTVVHSFEAPERFVVGTVGPPGQRTFFLQAREGSRIMSVALEKQQVAILAERLDLLLDEALRRLGGDPRIPALPPASLRDKGPLEQPSEEEFRVGTITLGWEEDSGMAVIELFPVTDENVALDELDPAEEGPAGDQDDGDGGDEPTEVIEVEIEASEVLIVKLEPAYARSFVQRALSVVSAGRPPCQFCGGPLDPEGHICPRANGFKRTTV